METKQVKAIFFFLTMIMALICRHQSEAIPFFSPIFGRRLSCLLAIGEVKGCANAINDALKGHLKSLDKKCCAAITDLVDCFPIFFPGRPYIGFLVIAACIREFDVNY